MIGITRDIVTFNGIGYCNSQLREPFLKCASEISKQATAAQVVGIVSIFFCGVLGPFTICRGSKTLRLICENNIRHEHASKANVGRIWGIIATALNAFREASGSRCVTTSAWLRVNCEASGAGSWKALTADQLREIVENVIRSVLDLSAVDAEVEREQQEQQDVDVQRRKLRLALMNNLESPN